VSSTAAEASHARGVAISSGKKIGDLHEEVGGGDGLLPEVNTCADRVPL
jgi:hypothetical protein